MEVAKSTLKIRPRKGQTVRKMFILSSLALFLIGVAIHQAKDIL